MLTNQNPQVIQDCHKLLQWLIPVLDKFPRSRRFTLGERLENRLLKVLEYLVEATYTQQKRQSLAYANRQLEIVRHLWRLSYELKTICPRHYKHGAKLINEIGQQIGGWLRSTERKMKNVE
jgi:hypothetical protein